MRNESVHGECVFLRGVTAVRTHFAKQALKYNTAKRFCLSRASGFEPFLDLGGLKILKNNSASNTILTSGLLARKFGHGCV